MLIRALHGNTAIWVLLQKFFRDLRRLTSRKSSSVIEEIYLSALLSSVLHHKVKGLETVEKSNSFCVV